MFQLISEPLLVAREGRIVQANPVAEDFLGMRAAQLLDLEAERLLEPAPAVLEPGQVGCLQARLIHPQTPGGALRGWVCGLDQGWQAWVLKGQLALADLGVLTAGLLHNLAGPLNVIRAKAEVLDTFLATSRAKDPAWDALVATWPETVQDACGYIAGVVDQMSASARDLLAKMRGEASQRLEPVNLNHLIRRELRLLEAEPRFRHQIQSQLDLDLDLPPVHGLYSDLSHVFRNLLRNAVQAMEQSPTKKLGVRTTRQDQLARVVIVDSGPGIPAHLHQAVFQPFVSLRQDAEGGTGLGLHLVQELLRPMGGRVRLASRPGRTAFTVDLPLISVQKNQQGTRGEHQAA